MKILKGGSRRTVVLIGKYALKFPSFYSFNSFVEGLIHNISEYEFSTMEIPELCPIIFRIPGGFLNVMPRCKCGVWPGWDEDDCKLLNDWQEAAKKSQRSSLLENIVEPKEDSVGRLPDGRVVAVDYGAPLVKIVYMKESV